MPPPVSQFPNPNSKHTTMRAKFVFISATILSFASLFSQRSYMNNIKTAEETATNRQNDVNGGRWGDLSPVQVAFGLSGNHPGFLAEFEVALKSVLLNAPLKRNLSIHILADQEAFGSLRQIFNRTELLTWRTRNPTQIYAYDVTPDHPQMIKAITDTFKPHYPDWTMGEPIHTIASYYRLFFDRYVSRFVDRNVSSTAQHVLYIDTDVVIMTNLEELWKLIELQSNALIHWGKGMCSGFVVMNVQRMKEILMLGRRSNLTAAYGQYDQTIYQAVNISYPSEVHVLPGGWDMTVTEVWQTSNQPYNKKFPNVGMLHFNGGGGSKEAYFGGENGTDHNFMTEFKDTWGNGKYYATLPWEWARYQATSLVRQGSKGHSIEFFS